MLVLSHAAIYHSAFEPVSDVTPTYSDSAAISALADVNLESLRSLRLHKKLNRQFASLVW